MLSTYFLKKNMSSSMMTSLSTILLLFVITCANCVLEQDIIDCEDILRKEYTIAEPVKNLLHGLTHLNEKKFVKDNPVPDEVKGYYLYLLRIVENQKLLNQVQSPHRFCTETAPGDPDEYPPMPFSRSTAAFRKIGCLFIADKGFYCFKQIYLNYIFDEITVGEIFSDYASVSSGEVQMANNRNTYGIAFTDYSSDSSDEVPVKICDTYGIDKIRRYITGPLQTTIENISNDHFDDWKTYCKSRLEEMEN